MVTQKVTCEKIDLEQIPRKGTIKQGVIPCFFVFSITNYKIKKPLLKAFSNYHVHLCILIY